jgi:sporulation protein YlmC with PRC-barrel domain
MMALTAVLSAPALLAAQTPMTTPGTATTSHTGTVPGTAAAPLGAAPAVTPDTSSMATNPATPGAPGVAPAATTSDYLTADQHVRASKIVGASIYNSNNDKIGSIDDVLIGSNDDVSNVVLSVGGFLGIASKLVEVPYKEIQVQNDRLVIPGATKDQLKGLPEYKYGRYASR